MMQILLRYLLYPGFIWTICICLGYFYISNLLVGSNNRGLLDPKHEKDVKVDY
jgi:hypothetical protein